MLVIFLHRGDHSEKLQCACNLVQSPQHFYKATSSSTPVHRKSMSLSGQKTPPRTSATDATPSSAVQDTPYARKLSGTYPFTSTNFVSANPRNDALAEEGKGHFVGPVPVREFFKYVPETDEKFSLAKVGLNEQKIKKFENDIRIAAKITEEHMYNPFLNFMNNAFLDRGNNFQIVNSSKEELAKFCDTGIKPDFVIHQGDYKKDDKFQLQNIELMVELKSDGTLDPFVDDDDDNDDNDNDQFESTTDQGKKCRGQITSYATCHLGMQGRTHVFQVLVINNYARFLRWDRSGVIVTEKIPLSEPAFFEFFWRFYHLTPSQRGWDTTVVKPTDEEIEIARPALEAAEKELGIRTNEGRMHYSKIGLKKESYIVHRFFSGTQSPFGRATRGYAAFGLKTKEVVFLKSTWRIVGEGRQPEHLIYEALHKAKVEHILEVVDSLDVEDHVTVTQDVPWRKKSVKPLRTLQHYFIVFKELCRQLATFKSTKELITAFADAADGHQQALDKAKILHRDVSAGNILIKKDGRGILADWDLGKYVKNESNDVPSQPERTGTFQFMSARFVHDKFDFGPHDRLDDIESFFHTLQWIVLRYINHGMNAEDLRYTLFITFDQAIPGGNGLMRCEGRLSCLHESIWYRCKDLEGVLPNLLEDLRQAIKTRYIPAGEMRDAEESYATYKNNKAKFNQIILKSMITGSKPAILNEQLQEPDWFRNLLRRAVEDPNCPTTDASQPQKYKSIKSNRIATSDKHRISIPDHYERPVPKKQRRGSRRDELLENAAQPTYNPENSDEETDGICDDDPKDLDYVGPSKRKREHRRPY